MRVISGEFKGRRLAVPPESLTRPTSDRAREAIFSSLESLRGGMSGAHVLDAFAGSGAMAIEALSRGASCACLIERSMEACSLIKENLSQLGLSDSKAVLRQADAFVYLPMAPDGEPFDVVFLDPPYSYSPDEVLGLIDKLVLAGAVTDDAVFLYEHDEKATALTDEAYDRSKYSLIKRRSYGRAVMDTLKQHTCANI